MDIDQLKANWKSFTPDPEVIDGVHERLLCSDNYKRALTLFDKLRHRYQRASALCIIGPLFLRPISHLIEIPVAVEIAYIGYFALMLILNLILLRRIKDFGRLDMPVKDAFVSVTKFAILRRRFECVGILLAIPLVVGLLVLFRSSGDSGMYWGGVVGAVLGVALGLFIDLRITKIIRRLKADLSRNLD